MSYSLPCPSCGHDASEHGAPGRFVRKYPDAPANTYAAQEMTSVCERSEASIYAEECARLARRCRCAEKTISIARVALCEMLDAHRNGGVLPNDGRNIQSLCADWCDSLREWDDELIARTALDGGNDANR